MGGAAGGQPWWLDALCAGWPVSAFYVEQRGARLAPEVRQLCALCLVREPCLEDALVVEQRDGRAYGFRGGLSAGQRLALIAERQVGGQRRTA